MIKTGEEGQWNAWNHIQPIFMADLSFAYGEAFSFSEYLKAISTISCPKTKETLELLGKIYVYMKISENASHYRDNDYLSSDQFE